MKNQCLPVQAACNRDPTAQESEPKPRISYPSRAAKQSFNVLCGFWALCDITLGGNSPVVVVVAVVVAVVVVLVVVNKQVPILSPSQILRSLSAVLGS